MTETAGASSATAGSCPGTLGQETPSPSLSVILTGSMARKKSTKSASAANKSPRIVNRKARHEYHIDSTLECGIQLLGSEVKSIRTGQVSLAEGYARVEPGDRQLYLYNVDIAMYAQAGPGGGHDPKRRRKLLAHRREIDRLLGSTTERGVTLVPLAMYFKRGYAKIEIGVCRGKRQFDKRQDMKKRDAGKDIRRAMTRQVIK